jgi:sulfite reductase (NADPH) hemoprotein beta-component
MASPNPYVSEVHREIYEHAQKISEHFLPKTKAYHEIWLDEKQVAGTIEEEPIYGKTYLPRKFKIAITVPPYNDVDVYANDLGLIAISENGHLKGYNVLVGGGMGMTFGNKDTHPRLADLIGYIPKEKVIELAENVVKIQRDNGNRSDRKLSRLKYTIEKMGLEVFKNELHNRLGWKLELPVPFEFESNNDRFGWYKSNNARWNLCLYVEGGRVKDTKDFQLKSALREIAQISDGSFILTGNQNLIIANVSAKIKTQTEAIFSKYKIEIKKNISGLRANSLACVALNTCSLAFAEAERYLPSLLDKIEVLLEKNNLSQLPINIRMTGCPNGCARPYLGEIALVGRAMGKYNLYLGASHTGNRLNFLYKEMLGEQEILDELDSLFVKFVSNRIEQERFGDFIARIFKN